MKIKIKKLHPDAVIPRYAKAGDAGLDLTAVSQEFEDGGGRRLQVYKTGIAVAIPEGYVGLLFPRSSVSKTSLSLTNSVGVLDSGYRGEIVFKYAISENARPTDSSTYKPGDRVGQLIVIPYPKVEFEEVGELDETERGTGGFGHTGN